MYRITITVLQDDTIKVSNIEVYIINNYFVLYHKNPIQISN